MPMVKLPGLPHVPKDPTVQTQEEIRDYEEEEKKARIAGIWQDIEERKKYAQKAFKLISFWIAGIFVLLILDGLKVGWFTFNLPDTIMLAAIGGTTVNILGVFIFVMKYLFDPKK